MDMSIFGLILGLGISIPFTCSILIATVVKIQQGSDYLLDINALSRAYVLALVGWSLFFSSIL